MQTHANQQAYTEWLLKVGNGTLHLDPAHKEYIQVPPNSVFSGDISSFVNKVFDNKIGTDGAHEISILCPKNDTCNGINQKIIKKMVGDMHTYESIDTIVVEDDADELAFPLEYLNSITPSGLPPHCLEIKM